MSTLWTWLGTNTGKITALFSMFGFAVTTAFSILTYYRHNRDGKLRAVDELRNLFFASVGSEAKMVIESFWASNEGQRILSCSDFDQIRERALASAQDRDHGPYLHFIRNHFADVARCVQSGRCDRNYACELYASRVHRFLTLYEEWLDNESKIRNEDLKKELDYFFDISCCGKLQSTNHLVNDGSEKTRPVA